MSDDRSVRDERRLAKRRRRRLASRGVADGPLVEGSARSASHSERPAQESERIAPELEDLVARDQRLRRAAVAGSLTTLSDTAERILLTISYGQSNAEAGGLGKRGEHQRMATPGIVDEHRAMMLNPGFLGVQGAALDEASLTDLVPAREDDAAGESGGSAYLRYSLACAIASGQPNSVHIYRTAGQKGQPLARLQEGTQPFRNFLTTVERAQMICRRYGKAMWMPHFFGIMEKQTGSAKPSPVNIVREW